MMNLKVICQICGETIAVTTLGDLRYPLNGVMFRSPDAAHGIPDPFHPSLEWVDFRCPYGMIHRPFVKDNEIMTHLGLVAVTTSGAALRVGQKPGVGRESISDRVVMMSEEEAEQKARAEIAKGNHGEAETEQREPEDEQPVEETAPALTFTMADEKEVKTVSRKKRRR